MARQAQAQNFLGGASASSWRNVTITKWPGKPYEQEDERGHTPASRRHQSKTTLQTP